MSHRNRGSEDGSFILVLLVALVVGGVLAALFMTVDTGVQSARQDRDFAQAFQVADAGVQDGYSTLMGLDPEDPDAAPPCGVVDGAATVTPCSRQLGDGSVVEWTYERQGTFGWTIDSHGTHLGSTRRIVAEFQAQGLFEADITAIDKVDIRGNITGLVSIASFCDIAVSGNAAHYEKDVAGISSVVLYGPEDPGCSVTSNPKGSLDRLHPFPRDPGPQITDRAAAVCTAPTAGIVVQETLDAEIERGTTYCVEELRSQHTLTGTSTEPAKVYIYGDFSGNVIDLKGSSGRINAGVDAEAGELEIYIANGGGDVNLGGASEMVAAVYAPYSSCTRKGNGVFRGAWFCRTVDSRGGFVPDPSAQQIRDGDLVLEQYSEEVPNA